MKINKKHLKIALMSWLGCFVIALLMYLVVISPQLQTKKQVSAQLAEVEKIHNEILTLNQSQARTGVHNQIQKWKSDIGEFVISTEDLANLTFDIGKIAKDLEVDSFSITSQDTYTNKPAASENFITQKQMKVDFKSDFNKFAAFLNAIERHRPAVLIDRFEINNTEHNANANQVNMVLSVFVKKKQGS
ncbi:MAG: General secretion pathway protein M [Planctomycetes bacterium ADurb.Bin401]|nr:MAG: General secretion pathway protein M [Planctomycetes bacterium ADurb.Bin401]